MDFAYFIWTEPQAMVVPRPGEEPRLFAFIRPFQPLVIMFRRYSKKVLCLFFFFNFVLTEGFLFSSKVWLLILISSISIVSSMSLLSKAYSKLFVKNVNDVIVKKNTTALKWASQYSIYVLNTLTNQGNISYLFQF
jgi:hypothetical protein